MEKFIVTGRGEGEPPIGVRYDSRPRKGIFQIGGRSVNQRRIETMACGCFGVDCVSGGPKVKVQWVQKYLIRFEAKLSRKEFLDGMERVKADGWTVLAAKTLRGVTC